MAFLHKEDRNDFSKYEYSKCNFGCFSLETAFSECSYPKLTQIDQYPYLFAKRALICSKSSKNPLSFIQICHLKKQI